MTLDLWSWVSPWDTYRTVAAVVEAAARVHLTGFTHGVLLPTVYDDWPQSQLSNNLGADLKVRSPEHARQLREVFEANGLRCGGWSVPRATGDVAAEGYIHGKMAAAFDYFIINMEDGWAGFWTADGRGVVDLWLGAFWSGVADSGATERLSGNVGVTWVTNTGMMNVVSDAEAAAWVGGTNFDCLEAYIPGDPGLDPGNAVRIWQARLDRIGAIDRAIVPILERGDLPALVQRYAHPERGAQIWTLSIAAAATWPAAEEPEQPVPDEPENPCAPLITALAYMGDDVGDRILAECKRPNVRKGEMRAVAAELARVRLEQVGPRP